MSHAPDYQHPALPTIAIIAYDVLALIVVTKIQKSSNQIGNY